MGDEVVISEDSRSFVVVPRYKWDEIESAQTRDKSIQFNGRVPGVFSVGTSHAGFDKFESTYIRCISGKWTLTNLIVREA